MTSPLIRLLSFVVCLLFSCASFLSAEQSKDISLQQVLSRKLIKSPSRRFTIVGSDVREGLELMNWAEQIAAKVEQAIGIGLPSGKSSAIRIVIYDYKNADPEDALETLCRLLLNSYVIDRQTRGQRSEIRSQIPHKVPFWLSRGLAQNLYSALRVRNSEVVLRRWQEGQLLPLAQFLRLEVRGQRSEVREDHSPDKAVCGLLLGWIRSFPNRRECFEKIFGRLAAGKPVSPEWFVTCIPACDSIADLEEEWDNWILRQKHIVYEPGTITSGLIDQLKAELLLYPGDFGIPLTSNLDQWIEFRDLIEQRDASWIPAFSSSKGISLRLLAAGRGKEFGDVVDSYCRFLEALRRGKSRRKLGKLLNRAEKELKELEKELEDRDQILKESEGPQ